MSRYVVTGAAGFIGYHLCARLLERGERVLGVDNLNDYYSVRLKRDRLAQLEPQAGFEFAHVDLADREATQALFAQSPCEVVLHMAAQPGVRYSLENPQAYVDSNLVAFANLLEGCRQRSVKHLVYASSSSVYGANRSIPFSVADNVDHPINLYAATKKANELMAHAYSHLFGMPTTGLRFFTVYGPWGRPDMAIYKFTEAILAGRPIQLFNRGEMRRDFTYIDDAVEAVLRLAAVPPTRYETGDDTADTAAPYQVFNVGNNRPEELKQVVATLERHLGTKAVCELTPLEPGDMLETYADIDPLMAVTGFRPETTIDTGIGKFVDWYRGYHRCSAAQGRA